VLAEQAGGSEFKSPQKRKKKNTAKKLGMVGHAYNPRTQEAERGES
jgi:hypothetical protein